MRPNLPEVNLKNLLLLRAIAAIFLRGMRGRSSRVELSIKRIAIAVVLALVPLHSGAQPPADAESVVRRAYARCAAALAFEPPPVLSADDEDWESVHVAQRGERWLVRYNTWGNGVEATYSGWNELFDPSHCTQLRYEWQTSDGAMRTEGVVRWQHRGEPTNAELREVAAERGDASNPAHAFARMWLSQTCLDLPLLEVRADGRWDLAGPMGSAQPWMRGRPVAPVATFWPDPQQQPGALRGSEVPGGERFGPPRRVRRVGRLEIWELRIRDRNGARAIAVYDRRADRHRWLTVTRGCINGTVVRWLGNDSRFAVGITESQHPVYQHGDGVLVLDLELGVAFRWSAEPSGGSIRALVARRSFFRELAERARVRAGSPAWPEPD